MMSIISSLFVVLSSSENKCASLLNFIIIHGIILKLSAIFM
jgi:hypothetical protein